MELSKVGSILAEVGKAGSSGANGAGEANFGDVLKSIVNQTVDAQHQAATLSTAAANGDNVAMHEVIQAVSKAELTLQTLVTVRDKAVEAYQQIMQMPV